MLLLYFIRNGTIKIYQEIIFNNVQSEKRPKKGQRSLIESAGLNWRAVSNVRVQLCEGKGALLRNHLIIENKSIMNRLQPQHCQIYPWLAAITVNTNRSINKGSCCASGQQQRPEGHSNMPVSHTAWCSSQIGFNKAQWLMCWMGYDPSGASVMDYQALLQVYIQQRTLLDKTFCCEIALKVTNTSLAWWQQRNRDQMHREVRCNLFTKQENE